MKNLIRILHFAFALLILNAAHAQFPDFEDYARQRESEFEQYKKEYEAFLNQMRQRYDEYVIQRDKEFTEYLNQRWESYQIFTGVRIDEKPKPVIMPRHEPQVEEPAARTLPVSREEVIMVERPAVEPELPSIQRHEPDRFPTRSLNLNFYGNRIRLTYDPAIMVRVPNTINNETIALFWTDASEANYNHLVNQLGEHRRQMNLNDWGYYMLVRNTAREIYTRSENGAVLLTWFLMNRSGYRARAAYYDNQAMLMLPSMHQIYEISYQVFDGIRFYLVEGDAPSVYTYDQDFPDAPRIMDMNINSPLNLGNVPTTRELTFDYGGETHSLEFAYCANTIKFYADYPQSQINVYFDSAVSPIAQESLAQNLMPLITDRQEADAANLLLRFTQTAFDYKTDKEQFGYEKFFFAEEVLHYPYSDCEDRSVLFAYLIRELLNLQVVGLEYDDHIATAVGFSRHPGGDYVVYNDEMYTVCDPTYINAPVGLTMPRYAEVEAIVIELDDSPHLGALAGSIWEQVYDFGGHRGGNRNDLVFDNMGNAYVTGFFRGEAEFGNFSLSSENETHGAFLAKFDYNGVLQWVRQPDSQRSAIAYHVALDPDQNIYFAGTFNDQVVFGRHDFAVEDYADVFLAKYDPSGRLQWAQRANLDTLNPANHFMFVTRFSLGGVHQGTDIYAENPDFNAFGIDFDKQGVVYLTGASFANTGMKVASMAYKTAEIFDPVVALKEENDRLLAQDYDRAIAGLFAAINLIKLENVVIPGAAAQQALDRYNPGFRRRAPTVYNAIANINFLKNEQGVVLITIEGGRSITIDYLRIRNNATIKVTEFSNGNTQLDVLSGLSVGRAIVWYDLNFVRLIRENGDMLFDYSRNNTQRTFNIEEDLFY